MLMRSESHSDNIYMEVVQQRTKTCQVFIQYIQVLAQGNTFGSCISMFYRLNISTFKPKRNIHRTGNFELLDMNLYLTDFNKKNKN